MAQKQLSPVPALQLILLACCNTLQAAEDQDWLYVSLHMSGSSVPGCSGGDWKLQWKDKVAIEQGPLLDLLDSYSAFDNSHEHQGARVSAQLDANPVTCRDDEGKVVLKAQIEPLSSEPSFTLSLANNPAIASPFVTFGSEAGTCYLTMMPGGQQQLPVMVALDSRMLTPLSPMLSFDEQAILEGFSRRYQFTGIVAGAPAMCMGGEILTGTLQMRFRAGPEDPEVSMEACLHLAKDEIRAVIAEGTPPGGSYDFESSDYQVLDPSVQLGNQTMVVGQHPGKAELTVTYQRDGKTAQASVAGSVVELVSINGGQALPELTLFDDDAEPRSDIYVFDLDVRPSDGYVQLYLENNILASVANTATSVQIQPIQPGTTQLKARTLCGTELGQPQPINIVKCNKQTRDKLKQQAKQLRIRIDNISKRITDLLSDSEFNRAADEIKQTTIDMATKTAESIISTLSLAQSQKIDVAAKTGVQLSRTIHINNQAIEITSQAWDIGNWGNDAQSAMANSTDLQGYVKPGIGALFLLARSAKLSLAKTYFEAYQVAEKFGRDLGLLQGVANELAPLITLLDQLADEHEKIMQKLKRCGQEESQSGEPDQDMPPPPKKRKPKKQPEEPELPPENEPTPPTAPEGDDSGSDDPIIDEQPTKRSFGLACQADSQDPAKLARQWQHMHKLAIAQQANITEGQQNLNKMQQQLDNIEQLLNQDDLSSEQLGSAIASYQSQADEFLLHHAQIGSASLNYLENTESCDEKFRVDIDDLRTQY
ncbi:hypothetical protein KJY73_02255 [Bowmanella sp. Y26]|uniref:hypothetical protein n=1 Tax=Bowmanella yangjiangensis TaxID=2811230 RepID=UPI001BDD5319|nr:hypothetical protein [Bowmanella yangjiangensis]MBT1062373.1 hypothetical protein [Bowmanella yangjiangensis]